MQMYRRYILLLLAVHANLEAKETREQSAPVECPRHAVWAAVNSILLPAAHTGCRKPV